MTDPAPHNPIITPNAAPPRAEQLDQRHVADHRHPDPEHEHDPPDREQPQHRLPP